MKKVDFENKFKELADEIKRLQVEQRDLETKFIKDCKHPDTQLHVKANYYEDEYGRHMSSWTDYTYVCKRCNTKVTVAKGDLCVPEVRELLKKEINK